MNGHRDARPGDLARITLSVLGIGVLIGGTLWVLRPFAPSFLWAVMIVVSTWPLMLRIQSWAGGRRGAAVAVMIVLLLLILFVPLYLAVSTVLSQSDTIAELVRSLPTRTVRPPPPWVETLPLIGHKFAQRWLELAALSPDQLADRLGPYLKTAVTWFAVQAGGFGSTLLQFLLTVGIAAVLYARGEGAAQSVRRFFRRLSGARGEVIVTLSGQAIRAVALGIVVTAVVQAALSAIGLVALGVPFAGVITAVVFILCIAQLGPLLAMLPCVIWLYAVDAPARATALLVLTLLAQTVDNVLRPLLIKRGADLSLLLIFPGVVGGLLWLGIIGLFIGPVILAVTSTLLDSWITTGLAEDAAPPLTPTVSAKGEGPPAGG